ncbi:MAG: hypothetical protein ACRDTZ_22450, partial [Pseudonocardiaceae bacterium]
VGSRELLLPRERLDVNGILVKPEPGQRQDRRRAVQRRHPPSKIHHAVIITAERGSASHDTPQLPLQY